MKKLLAATALIIVIGLSLSFIGGRLWAQGADSNVFNSQYRSSLAKHPALRAFFGLRETGDAQADYLGSRYRNILIEVDSMAGSAPQSDAIYQLAARVKAVTGKDTSIYFSDTDIPAQPAASVTDIDQLTKTYRNSVSSGQTAAIYLLILNAPADDPTLLGMTHHEDEIVLFTQGLQNFTADSTSTFANYELSTALHEFGHLLGLPHNEQPGCLMNSHAEPDHVPKFSAGDVVTDFCPYEQQLIRSKVK